MALDLHEQWSRGLGAAALHGHAQTTARLEGRTRRHRHDRCPPRVGAPAGGAGVCRARRRAHRAPRRPPAPRGAGRAATGARPAALRAAHLSRHAGGAGGRTASWSRWGSGRTTRTWEGGCVLDFSRFSWVEEDQPVMGHAHDPWKRIDVLAQRPARRGRARRHGPGGVPPTARPLRDAHDPAVVPATRGRADGPADSLGHAQRLRLQG